jgi:hypothetical protein
VLVPVENPYLFIAALSSSVGLMVLLARNEISRRRERVLFEKELSECETRLSNCDNDRLSLSIQLEQTQKELATARAVMNCRGRFIARIKPMFRQMAGDRADYKRQSEVFEGQLKQVCDEVDAQEAAKERETPACVTLDIAEIIVAHA